VANPKTTKMKPTKELEGTQPKAPGPKLKSGTRYSLPVWGKEETLRKRPEKARSPVRENELPPLQRPSLADYLWSTCPKKIEDPLKQKQAQGDSLNVKKLPIGALFWATSAIAADHLEPVLATKEKKNWVWWRTVRSRKAHVYASRVSRWNLSRLYRVNFLHGNEELGNRVNTK